MVQRRTDTEAALAGRISAGNIPDQGQEKLARELSLSVTEFTSLSKIASEITDVDAIEGVM
eukprot:3941873-Rhodomonas_salina.3